MVERITAALRRFLPSGWLAARVDPGRPGATALALVAAGAAVVAAVGVWTERPRAAPVPALPAVTVGAHTQRDAAGPNGPDPVSPGTGPLVVSVVGKVHKPGLVEVPDGARVADVVTAAGGALPGVDLSGINLARRVGDGEQLAVGVPEAAGGAAASTVGGAGTGAGAGTGRAGGDTAGSAAATGSGAGSAAGAKVDLNRATAQQLDALPGIGPVTAERILEWRARSGRFARVDQLREIEGIGERRFGQLRELVTVG